MPTIDEVRKMSLNDAAQHPDILGAYVLDVLGPQPFPIHPFERNLISAKMAVQELVRLASSPVLTQPKLSELVNDWPRIYHVATDSIRPINQKTVDNLLAVEAACNRIRECVKHEHEVMLANVRSQKNG